MRLVPWALALFIGSALLGFGSLFGFRFLGGSNGDLEALLFFVTQTALIVFLCSVVLLLLPLLLWRK